MGSAYFSAGKGALIITGEEDSRITIEALEAYGTDAQAGLDRRMGMKDVYLRLVDMELSDENFDKLESALAA